MQKNFFSRFFEKRKVIPLPADLTLAELQAHHEAKAREDAATMVAATFESPLLFKRVFYAERVDSVLELLDVQATDRVLDVACGVGYYTKKIGERTSHVIAADISKEYVKHAKMHGPPAPAEYLVCPAENLPFPDSSFDKVLFLEAVTQVLEPAKAFDEINRVLRPGGRVVVSCANRRSYLVFLYGLWSFLSGSLGKQNHLREFSKKEFQTLLLRHFSVTRFRYVNYVPFFLPAFFARAIGFERIKDISKFLGRVFNRIPILRHTGLLMFFTAEKPEV